MPTIDRRGRARKKADAPALAGEALHAAIRDAAGDSEAWATLRPQAIRGIAKGNLKLDDAARIADAYWRKPHYIPRPPPASIPQSEIES